VNGDFCGSGSEREFTGRASNDQGRLEREKEIKEVISKWQRKAEAAE
jgi:hypothetical protein